MSSMEYRMMKEKEKNNSPFITGFSLNYTDC